MGIMLHQLNTDRPYEWINFFPESDTKNAELNNWMNIILFEQFNGDFNAFDKEFGISVQTNPLQDIVRVDLGKIKECKFPVENLGTYRILLWNKVLRMCSGFRFNVYSDEENKGIKCKDATREEVCLARYSKAIAEEFNGMNGCYTAVKYAFLNAGIIGDYGDMPLGKAKDAIPYFENNSDKFRRIDVKKEDLTKLPAGKIIVYTKEGLDGHIAITTGNGQEMSDCTDNMKWLEEHGEGSSFRVYELTDKWKYNFNTKTLEFKK